MQRRNLLIGMGSLAAGGAATIGTGAFDNVSAERTVNVSVADDANAYLSLDPSGSPYAYENGNGETVVDLSGNGEGGQGINQNATTVILDIFEIQNQGTNSVITYVDPDSVEIAGNSLDSATDYIDPQASDLPNGSGDFTDRDPEGYDAVSMTAVRANAANPVEFANEADTTFSDGAGVDELKLSPGESLDFGLYITEEGGSLGSGGASMEIVADSNIVGGA